MCVVYLYTKKETITKKIEIMRNVYQNLSGFIFNENRAKEYYGERFESMLNNNLLIKVVLDEDGNIIGEW